MKKKTMITVTYHHSWYQWLMIIVIKETLPESDK